MPAYPSPPQNWLAQQLASLEGKVAALTATSTQYVVSPSTGVCEAIVGNVAVDHEGHATGLSGWGVAAFTAGEWQKLAVPPEWEAYTPVSVSGWSGATAEGRYQLVGKTLNVWIKISSASGEPSGAVTVSLPASITGLTGITQNLSAFGTFNGVTYAGVGTVTSGSGVANPYMVSTISTLTANYPLNLLNPASWVSSSVVLQGTINVN